MALVKTAPALSADERSHRHLAELEMQAHAQLAAADAGLETQVSNRLGAARLYSDSTHARLAEMQKAHRAAQERLAAYPQPRRTITDRLLGRTPTPNGLDKLEREAAAARADFVVAARAATSADGNLARVEKAESLERAQRLAELETQRRAGLERLAEIAMARRIVQAFPPLVYSGPALVAWVGGKVERKRRGLRNPNAKTIWGLPIDFGY